jgi:hypothetical protein
MRTEREEREREREREREHARAKNFHQLIAYRWKKQPIFGSIQIFLVLYGNVAWRDCMIE